jgi:hypothetical protein
MALLRECSHPGCATLTLGTLCIGHEAPVMRVFPRGRPFVRPVLVAKAPAGGAAAPVLQRDRPE